MHQVRRQTYLVAVFRALYFTLPDNDLFNLRPLETLMKIHKAIPSAPKDKFIAFRAPSPIAHQIGVLADRLQLSRQDFWLASAQALAQVTGHTDLVSTGITFHTKET